MQAFKLAEELSIPVMVCMDGFVLTHAFEAVDLPTQEQVDAFLPPFEPRQVLDPDEPVTIGAMVGPEAFTEVKYLMHAKQMQALDSIPELAAEFAQAFGRTSGGLVRRYRSEDAETIVVALGSVLGTIEEVVDELREQGVRDRGARDHVLPALAARGGPGRARAREAGRRAREGVRGRDRRDRRPERPPRARPGCPCRSTTSSPGSAAGRSRSARCTGCSATCSTTGSSPGSSTFLDLDWRLVERELLRIESRAALRAARREHAPRHRRRRRAESH